jgi:hypothetical protein
MIQRVIRSEEESFGRTLERGLQIFAGHAEQAEEMSGTGLDKTVATAFSSQGSTVFSVSKRPLVITSREDFIKFNKRKDVTKEDEEVIKRVCRGCDRVGMAVNGAPTVEETRTSSNSFWTAFSANRPGRTRLVRGSSYVQTQPQAAMLAEFLRDRYQLPRLSWVLRNAPGDPFRRLGDRVTVGVSPYDPVRGIITFRAR